jgi:hypothetical protein
MKEIVKQIREEVDVHGKKLFITLEGVDDKAERAINKKKARELMDMADKVLVTNYDYPKGSSGGIVPVSPMKWIKENFDFYCEVYSKAKLVPKLIMVRFFLFRRFRSTDTTSQSTVNMKALKQQNY